MSIVLSFVSIVLMVTGAVMGLVAYNRYRSPEAPARLPAWNPRHWRPVWKMRPYFTNETGYRMFIAGTCLLSFGAFIAAIVFIIL